MLQIGESVATLPVGKVRHPPAATARGRARRRVLVVEDDPMQRAVLAAFLDAQDYEVETASDGLMAIDKSRHGKFDIVLMDYRLPVLNGVTTARLIRAMTRFGGSPAMLAVTVAPGAVREDAAHGDAVFDAIIAKPWTRRSLREAIEAVTLPGVGGSVTAPQSRIGSGIGSGIGAGADAGTEAGMDGRPRVLIIDSSAISGTRLRTILAKKGYAADIAANPEAALTMVTQRDYDATVLGDHAAALNGIPAAKRILEAVPQGRRPRLIGCRLPPPDEDRFPASRILAQRDAAGLFDTLVRAEDGLPAMLEAIEGAIWRKLGWQRDSLAGTPQDAPATSTRH